MVVKIYRPIFVFGAGRYHIKCMLFELTCFCTQYTVSQKTCTNCFGKNFVKFPSILIIQSTGLRSGEFVGHSVGGMKSNTFRSRKVTVSRARCAGAVLSKDKNPPWDIQNMYDSSFWARRL